jgi:uncharacterized protein
MINTNSERIHVVDALRGFAIMSIMLLHNLEHFDFYYIPTYLPEWVKVLDRNIFDIIAFLFSGKSYAIFALLFGFTFYLMDSRQAQKGVDFRMRFMWRLFLLFIFGLLNTVFYQGDILNMYAIMGITLIPVCRLKDKTVLIIAILMILQPVFWYQFFYRLANPGYIPVEGLCYKYFHLSSITQGGDSFIEMVKGNFTNGKIAVYLWSWDKGRFFQAPALFMLGMLLGRRKMFDETDGNRKFWKATLIISAVLTIFFMLFIRKSCNLVPQEYAKHVFRSILDSWYNLSMMLVLVSGFILLYRTVTFEKILSKLIPFGRMSLTNYVMQSMLGAFIYYGFALGLYKYTGASLSLIIGIALFLFQAWFSKKWLRKHKQGPLEYIWHKGTWIKL